MLTGAVSVGAACGDALCSRVPHAERDQDGATLGGGRELGDAVGEALLDPLQDEAIRREQPIAARPRPRLRAGESTC